MKIAGRILMVLLSLSIGAYAFTFLDFKLKSILLDKGELAKQLIYQIGFYSHVTGGGLALISGAFQFFPKLRQRRLSLHRFLGKIYVLVCLWSGFSGFFIALYATGGPVAKTGFVLLAIFWVYSTIMAYRTIRKKDIEAHREWMIRSYALTFAAVTLRLHLPIYMGFMGLDFIPAYRLVSWTAWVPNLLVVEWFIQRQANVASKWIPSFQNSKS